MDPRIEFQLLQAKAMELANKIFNGAADKSLSEEEGQEITQEIIKIHERQKQLLKEQESGT